MTRKRKEKLEDNRQAVEEKQGDIMNTANAYHVGGATEKTIMSPSTSQRDNPAWKLEVQKSTR